MVSVYCICTEGLLHTYIHQSCCCVFAACKRGMLTRSHMSHKKDGCNFPLHGSQNYSHPLFKSLNNLHQHWYIFAFVCNNTPSCFWCVYASFLLCTFATQLTPLLPQPPPSWALAPSCCRPCRGSPTCFESRPRLYHQQIISLFAGK